VSRRRIQFPVVLMIVASFLLAACGAPRAIKYYVIDLPPAPAPAATASFPFTLLVGRITASHLYHDDRLVYGSGPVQLGTYEYDRWAEPPADMVQDLLISTLRSTGQYAAVARVSSNVRGDYVLHGHLTQMYGVDQPAQVARFSLQLELYDPQGRATVWNQTYTHDEPVQGKTVSSIVEAMDRNVKSGLQQLSAGLSQYFAAHPPAAPAAK
jgi:cholesterol transport system auxiliary component